MSYSNFKSELAAALGKAAAETAEDDMALGSAAPDRSADRKSPADQIQDQADAIAAAIKTYLQSLATSSEVSSDNKHLKKP